MARSFVAIPHLLLMYTQCSGAPECPGHISSSVHNCQSHSTINTVDTIIEFRCQSMRPWTHLFMATLQRVQEYHSRSGTPEICIPGRLSLRHGSGIHGEAVPFAAGYVLAYDLAND
jgi:hypothetical protein